MLVGPASFRFNSSLTVPLCGCLCSCGQEKWVLQRFDMHIPSVCLSLGGQVLWSVACTCVFEVCVFEAFERTSFMCRYYMSG